MVGPLPSSQAKNAAKSDRLKKQVLVAQLLEERLPLVGKLVTDHGG